MSALVAESDLTAFPVCVTPTLIIRSTFQRILYQNTIFAPIRPLLSLRRPHELDLEAAAVGGLAVAAAGIVEVEDDFTGETDCRIGQMRNREGTAEKSRVACREIAEGQLRLSFSPVRENHLPS